MGSLYDGGLWCPQCGAEYRPGFATCADCGDALVDEPPSPPYDDRLHDYVEYDLSEWTSDQRAEIRLLLRVSDVTQRWDGGYLAVPKSREAEVDELVDDIDEGSTDDGAALVQAHDDHEDEEPFTVAGPGRRLLGAVVDALVLGAVTAPFTYPLLLDGRRTPRSLEVGLACLAAIYEIGAVAGWGRTVGKVVARTRVVDATTGDVPSWGQAALRCAVPAALGTAVLLLPRGSSTASVLTVADRIAFFVIVSGIFWDRRRQGLHDKAARTVVIRD